MQGRLQGWYDRALKSCKGKGSAARLVWRSRWRRRWGWPPGLENGSRQAECPAYYCCKLSVEGR
ncbi:hypothetical protein GOP47_0005979 [Adiantum capillus-veneris]|uniref:Uncharacterized protein n=1 Tax=Adiantum capillus-veneris TaxID=13818 RepID=A0A9D4ZJW5_ADICA|nr:hypothetical protein GOP47_0005979 [Adiantum capillus-veneris]